MTKIAVVVLADTETHADLGRIANALELAKEAKESGDEVQLIFDGGGTRWVPALEDSGHLLHKLYSSVRDVVAGACAYCAAAFEVKQQVQEAGVKLISDYEGHPSLRGLIVDGYSVVTF